jgi:hypothetical protein
MTKTVQTHLSALLSETNKAEGSLNLPPSAVHGLKNLHEALSELEYEIKKLKYEVKIIEQIISNHGEKK